MKILGCPLVECEDRKDCYYKNKIKLYLTCPYCGAPLQDGVCPNCKKEFGRFSCGFLEKIIEEINQEIPETDFQKIISLINPLKITKSAHEKLHKYIAYFNELHPGDYEISFFLFGNEDPEDLTVRDVFIGCPRVCNPTIADIPPYSSLELWIYETFKKRKVGVSHYHPFDDAFFSVMDVGAMYHINETFLHSLRRKSLMPIPFKYLNITDLKKNYTSLSKLPDRLPIILHIVPNHKSYYDENSYTAVISIQRGQMKDRPLMALYGYLDVELIEDKEEIFQDEDTMKYEIMNFCEVDGKRLADLYPDIYNTLNPKYDWHKLYMEYEIKPQEEIIKRFEELELEYAEGVIEKESPEEIAFVESQTSQQSPETDIFANVYFGEESEKPSSEEQTIQEEKPLEEIVKEPIIDISNLKRKVVEARDRVYDFGRYLVGKIANGVGSGFDLVEKGVVRFSGKMHNAALKIKYFFSKHKTKVLCTLGAIAIAGSIFAYHFSKNKTPYKYLPEKTPVVYTVKPNDNLWSIVKHHYNLESNKEIARYVNSIVDYQKNLCDDEEFLTRINKDLVYVSDGKVYKGKDGIKGDLIFPDDKFYLPSNPLENGTAPG